MLGSGTTQRLPLAAATSHAIQRPHAVFSPGEPGIAAPQMELPTVSAGQGDFSLGVQSVQQYWRGHEVSGDGADRLGEPSGTGAIGGDDRGVPGIEKGGKFIGRGAWRQRHLPYYAELQVIGLLDRMVHAASLCQSLLPLLNASQGLRLTREVTRLLALDLGAISLVRDHLEPNRLQLGNALVNLASNALELSSGDTTLEDDRTAICTLVSVIDQLKNPRPHTEKACSRYYKDKMRSILQTADKVRIYLTQALEELVRAMAPSQGLTPANFEQKLRVIRALYRVHSNHIARDSSLRFYIVAVQEELGLKPILGPHHHQMANTELPLLMDLEKEIDQAVLNSGGRPPQPQESVSHQSIAVSSELLARSRELPPLVQLYGVPMHEQQQGGFTPGPPAFVASTGPTTLQEPGQIVFPNIPQHRQGTETPPRQGSSGFFASSSHRVNDETTASPPFLMPRLHAPPQGFRGAHWQFLQTPNLAALQSHQRVSVSPSPTRFLPQQPLMGAASASSESRSSINYESFQAFPSAFSGPEFGTPVGLMNANLQDAQRAPSMLLGRASSEEESSSRDEPKGSEGTGATMPVDSMWARWRFPPSHHPPAVFYPGPRQSRRDLVGAQPREDVPFQHHNLFGHIGQPSWTQTSPAFFSQPLRRESGQMHQPRQEGAIRGGVESQMLEGLLGSLRLEDSTSRGADDSSRE
ncbi:hypothetical protein, conserved [Eimeria maxima]|uniref:Uncharacterized protein n=1 Tax=Eimeria maxima TaxID=5804 RepID=U6M8L5_EIMMA|nr:hypothetical protein, conserved [Eimeria maxima]CDJ60371.1 hypothetical protein, conserved [Eimeria maxima]